MKALILDGSDYEEEIIKIAYDTIKEELESVGWSLNYFLLRDTKIAPCLGCFSCWIKTPGICAIDDAGRNIARLAAQSDLWVFLTPLKFGGYSSDLKKAVDRLLPLLLPPFIKINGYTYHPWRSDKHPRFNVFGMIKKSDDEMQITFGNLVNHNATNFHINSYASEIFMLNDTAETIKIKTKEVFKKTGVLN